MNSKEALEILFASYNFDGNYHDLIIARERLEQDLDRLKQIEKALDILKKVFEIKNVHEEVDVYVIETETYLLSLTKEEYELLKEVLNNDK